MQLADQIIVHATMALGELGFTRAVWPWGEAEMTEKPWLGLQPVVITKPAACKKPAAKQTATTRRRPNIVRMRLMISTQTRRRGERKNIKRMTLRRHGGWQIICMF